MTHGREQEAVVALRAIATYNAQPIDIAPADVHVPQSSPSQAMGPRRGLERDKKNSELPSPTRESDKLSPELSTIGLPSYREVDDETSASSSRTLYDSVGLGPAPPPRTVPVRLGSAFYSASIAGSPSDAMSNAFDRSFADAADRRRMSTDLAEEVEEEADIDEEAGEALLPD